MESTQTKLIIAETLELEREAQRFFRFKPMDDLKTQLGTVYIAKSAFDQRPKHGDRVRITVEQAGVDAPADRPWNESEVEHLKQVARSTASNALHGKVNTK